MLVSIEAKDIEPPEAEVAGSCKLPGMGFGNPTWVPCKCYYLLGYFSSLVVCFKGKHGAAGSFLPAHQCLNNHLEAYIDYKYLANSSGFC